MNKITILLMSFGILSVFALSSVLMFMDYENIRETLKTISFHEKSLKHWQDKSESIKEVQQFLTIYPDATSQMSNLSNGEAITIAYEDYDDRSGISSQINLIFSVYYDYPEINLVCTDPVDGSFIFDTGIHSKLSKYTCKDLILKERFFGVSEDLFQQRQKEQDKINKIYLDLALNSTYYKLFDKKFPDNTVSVGSGDRGLVKIFVDSVYDDLFESHMEINYTVSMSIPAHVYLVCAEEGYVEAETFGSDTFYPTLLECYSAFHDIVDIYDYNIVPTIDESVFVGETICNSAYCPN